MALVLLPFGMLFVRLASASADSQDCNALVFIERGRARCVSPFRGRQLIAENLTGVRPNQRELELHLGGGRALNHYDPTESRISHKLLKIYRLASSACTLPRVFYHRARHNMANETPLRPTIIEAPKVSKETFLREISCLRMAHSKHRSASHPRNND